MCALKQHHLDLSSACSSCSFVFSAELMQQLGTAFEAADSAIEKTTISIQLRRRSGAMCAFKQHHLDLSSACSSCSFVFSTELMQQLGTAFEAADSAIEKTTISIQLSDGLEPCVLSSSITWICLPLALLAASSLARNCFGSRMKPPCCT